MLFSSQIFIFGFLFMVLVIYVIVARSMFLKNLLLFIFSVIFYAWGEPRFVVILLASIVINYAFGLLVGRLRAKRRAAYAVIAATLVCNLGLLFVFKYLDFSVENINALFGSNLALPGIALPIGISFFTFQAISYVLDIYRGHGEAQRSIINVGLYISFFPQLIAGPIVRYETIAKQINDRRVTLAGFSTGVTRFVTGLAKKVLISNQMAIIADAAYDATGQISVAMAWLGALAYAFQIYYDFSGYSDMAIGLGRMFGFEFLENFDYPYVSRSVTEFWRRWHISLGTWFRDYVYFPLGGSREGRGRTALNLLIVWLLTGAWHGASWNFVLWGLYFFLFIMLEKTFFPGLVKSGARPRMAVRALGRAYTLVVVFFGWVLFRTETLPALGSHLGLMFGAAGAPGVDGAFIMYLREKWVFLLAAAVFSAPVRRLAAAWLERLRQGGARALATAASVAYPLVQVSLFLISVAYLIKGTYNPFIYFNF